jgi:hypothetical protein
LTYVSRYVAYEALLQKKKTLLEEWKLERGNKSNAARVESVLQTAVEHEGRSEEGEDVTKREHQKEKLRLWRDQKEAQRIQEEVD